MVRSVITLSFLLSLEYFMVRTQIQLTDEQAREIKKVAAAKGVSVAEIVRRAVEGVIKSSAKADREERQRRALEIVGKFRSGKRNVSKKHDAYLTETYSK
jgi:signal transduction protein with GAF and PtsI domain